MYTRFLKIIKKTILNELILITNAKIKVERDNLN